MNNYFKCFMSNEHSHKDIIGTGFYWDNNNLVGKVNSFKSVIGGTIFEIQIFKDEDFKYLSFLKSKFLPLGLQIGFP